MTLLWWRIPEVGRRRKDPFIPSAPTLRRRKDPFTPSAPTLRRGVSRGPHSPVFGVGPTPVLATELRCALWTITVHACYSTRVIPTPDAPTIHSSLSTMEHPCPILFRPVPPQIRHVEHLVFHFSAKCSIAQIGMEHFGTQWNTSHGNPPPNAPTIHYPTTPIDRSTQPQGAPARPVEGLRLVAAGAHPAGLRDVDHHAVGTVVLGLYVWAMRRGVHRRP